MMVNVRWSFPRLLLAVGAALLPVALAIHAVTFWDRGIIDKEALTFVVNYLAPRPFVAAIFDPRLNDWNLYQARELSYVFDFIDARVFAALLDKGLLLFVPVSGVIGLIAVAAIYLWGARKVMRLDLVTSALLLSLFLSCIVTQASTPIFYRSSKIVLSAALVAFLFCAAAVGSRRAPAPRWSLTAFFVLGLVMSMSDRQGFYYLVVTTALLGALWFTSFVPGEDPGSSQIRRNCVRGVIVGLCAIAVATLYNDSIAPAVIHAENGYWPDFTFQQLQYSDLLNRELLASAWRMMREQTSYFFGNAPFLVVGAVFAIAVAASSWRLRSATPILILLTSAAALVVLLATMILRHPPVRDIPDHSFWYYTLTMHVVFLFGTTILIGSTVSTLGTWRTSLLYGLVLLMIGNNVAHYPGQRLAMIKSTRWFTNQYAHSQRFANDFEAMNGGDPPGERTAPSWVRVSGSSAIVTLPIRDQGFLDGVQAAYATLMHRAPLASAEGPFWSGLRALLESPGSPLGEPDQMDALLAGFQSVGVREVVIDRRWYRDRDLASTTVDAALAATTAVLKTADDGRAVTIALKNEPLRPPTRRISGPIPPQSFTVTTSGPSDSLPLAFDQNPETRWDNGRPQTGDEWLRIDFKAPHDVARLRFDLAGGSLGDYPRRLLIASVDGEQSRTLYEGPSVDALVRGLLRDPARAPIEISLPANRTTTLLVRQTGRARTWFWSVYELTLWEH